MWSTCIMIDQIAFQHIDALAAQPQLTFMTNYTQYTLIIALFYLHYVHHPNTFWPGFSTSAIFGGIFIFVTIVIRVARAASSCAVPTMSVSCGTNSVGVVRVHMRMTLYLKQELISTTLFPVYLVVLSLKCMCICASPEEAAGGSVGVDQRCRLALPDSFRYG